MENGKQKGQKVKVIKAWNLAFRLNVRQKKTDFQLTTVMIYRYCGVRTESCMHACMLAYIWYTQINTSIYNAIAASMMTTEAEMVMCRFI